jgi:putative aldouronate transport system substrate-binding protein
MKRFVFMGLSIVLALGIAGCSTSSNSNENTTAAPVQSTAAATAPAETESNTAVDNSAIEATGKVYDTGGVKLPLAEPGKVELTYMGNDIWVPNRSFKDMLPVQKEIEKRTGIKMNFDVYSTDTELVLQTRLASGVNLPDIVEIPPFDSNIGVQRYATNGVLLPMTDLIDKYAPNIKKLFEKYPNLKAAATSPDGNIYGIPGFWGDINEVVPDWIMIRKDWLDKLNLTMPTTPDELYNVLKTFYEKDPNGNSKPDEVPMVTLNLLATRYLMTGFGFQNNSDWFVENDKTQYAPVDARYKALLTYLNKLYKEKLLSTDIEGSQRQQVIAQNKAGVYVHDPSDWLSGFDTLVKAEDPKVDYQFIPVLKASADAPATSLVKRNNFWHYYGITKDTKNPELAMKWIDYVYASKDGQMLYGYGVEGLSYNLNSEGKPEFTDLILHNKDYDSPFLALRSIGAWPSYLINDPAEAFLAAFKGTKVETVGNEYIGKMVEPFPQMLGTQEESDTLTEIWPDLQTYLNESFTNFVLGNEPIENFDKYVKQAYTLGLQKIIDIKDAQYKRYQKVVGK